MIHVLSGNAVHSFAGKVWAKTTRSCPAPCCDVDCEECPAEGDCPHSEHGTDGICVFERDGDEFRCLAYFPPGAAISDCSCEDAESCPHGAPLKERAEKLGPEAPRRKAGAQRDRFLASRTPVGDAAVEEKSEDRGKGVAAAVVR